jgi:hypothetical protein
VTGHGQNQPPRIWALGSGVFPRQGAAALRLLIGLAAIQAPPGAGAWLKAEAAAGDQRSRTILAFAARALDQLRNLTDQPS